GGITFTRHDLALPFFPDIHTAKLGDKLKDVKFATSILKWTPILDDMNRYGLKVVGLNPGKYALSLGQDKVAVYTHEELAKGVNIAGPSLAAGPIADQVEKVWNAIKDKNKYFHDSIFRGVILANAKSAAFKDVDAKDLEAKRKVLFAERMQKMPELDMAVR